MSHDDRKPPVQRRASEPEALLEDLESIRDLLDAEPRTLDDDDIPVLREVVRSQAAPVSGRSSGHRTARDEFSREDASGEESDRAEVQADLFDARMFADRLLDETWQQQSNAVLASARRTADALTARLAPQASTAARERLRARLANELPPLLEQVVGEAIDDLQNRLLRVLRQELARLTEAALTERHAPSAPTDEPSHDD
ncbi:MAG: hypothetical protein JJU22_02970 [Gammaproteobacteria bacterium]|nr:hypothetical protein [Gammaproteobacteria bacterium]